MSRPTSAECISKNKLQAPTSPKYQLTEDGYKLLLLALPEDRLGGGGGSREADPIGTTPACLASFLARGCCCCCFCCFSGRCNWSWFCTPHSNEEKIHVCYTTTSHHHTITLRKPGGKNGGAEMVGVVGYHGSVFANANRRRLMDSALPSTRARIAYGTLGVWRKGSRVDRMPVQSTWRIAQYATIAREYDRKQIKSVAAKKNGRFLEAVWAHLLLLCIDRMPRATKRVVLDNFPSQYGPHNTHTPTRMSIGRAPDTLSAVSHGAGGDDPALACSSPPGATAQPQCRQRRFTSCHHSEFTLEKRASFMIVLSSWP